MKRSLEEQTSSLKSLVFKVEASGNGQGNGPTFEVDDIKREILSVKGLLLST